MPSELIANRNQLPGFDRGKRGLTN